MHPLTDLVTAQDPTNAALWSGAVPHSADTSAGIERFLGANIRFLAWQLIGFFAVGELTRQQQNGTSYTWC